jgi:hypothetical protein
MATQFAFGKIVTDGLVLALDAADKNSYPGSGTTWRDLAGINNGALINGVTFAVDSLSFDGVDDFVSGSSNLNISGDATFSICYWARWNGTSFSGDYPSGVGNNSTGNTNQGLSTTWNGGRIALDFWVNRFRATTALNVQTWYHVCFTKTPGLIGSTSKLYVNGQEYPGAVEGTDTTPNITLSTFVVGRLDASRWFNGNIANVQIYNRALSQSEILQNYNAQKSRNLPGSLYNPFLSPVQAQNSGYAAGSYYFKSGAMSSPLLLEYQPNYYESKPFCCVFRSPYESTATTNRIDLSIPMGGLLVQRDALDLRGAVYWSTPITYNSVGGTGNNTADSGTGYAGSNSRRVMLGFAGGHGLFSTSQQQCNWGTATGAIGAGWNGSTCGAFPNGLIWGTGRSDTATYENRSGTWSHWVTWN